MGNGSNKNISDAQIRARRPKNPEMEMGLKGVKLDEGTLLGGHLQPCNVCFNERLNATVVFVMTQLMRPSPSLRTARRFRPQRAHNLRMVYHVILDFPYFCLLCLSPPWEVIPAIHPFPGRSFSVPPARPCTEAFLARECEELWA